MFISLRGTGLRQKCQQSTAQSSQDLTEIFPLPKQTLGQAPGQRQKHRLTLESSRGICADRVDQRLLGSLTQTGPLHFPKYHHLFLCFSHQTLSELPKWNSFTTSRKIHRSRHYRIIFSDTDKTCNFFLSKWEETYHCSSKRN